MDTAALKQSAFSYDLPVERIAQRPVYPYDRARLLVYSRVQETLVEGVFFDIAKWLQPGDLLVFNDSRVIPARLYGRRADTGGAVEILLIREESPGNWTALGKPLKKLKAGTVLVFDAGITGEVRERTTAHEIRITFSVDSGRSFNEALAEVGRMPIPPYIRAGQSDAKDTADYQSVFARFDGSVAAPTASLHFTPAVLERLTASGIHTETVTLHVGPASFLPIFKPDSEEPQKPGLEKFQIQDAVWERIQQTKNSSGRVIAVGTTMVRALESRGRSMHTETELFITPGFPFSVVDGIITNFHQPGTTHLLLVQAFIGDSALTKSYQYALDQGFRFLSYGDGMLLL